MRLAALLAAALLAADPAAAQDPAALYRQGVDARLAGDTGRAVELLRAVTAAQPDNADAQLQLGLALLAQGELDAAQAAFERVLTIAPDYADARIGLARVAQRRGDRAAARAALEPVDPGNADAQMLRNQLDGDEEAGGWRYQLDADLSYSDLEQDRPSWKEGTLRLSWRPGDRATTIAGGVEVSNRFDRTDAYFEARVDHRFSPLVALYASLGATPDADFRPEWQIGGGGSVRLRAGDNPTIATLDARQARYAAGDIQTINPGVEQYLAGGRAWLTGRWINTFDETGKHSSGWLARGDAYASDTLRLFAGASDAPDTSAGVVVPVFNLFGGLSWDVGERQTLRLSVAHENRDVGADRIQFSLGLGVRF